MQFCSGRQAGLDIPAAQGVVLAFQVLEVFPVDARALTGDDCPISARYDAVRVEKHALQGLVVEIVEQNVRLPPTAALPREYRPLQVEHPLPDFIQSGFVYLPSRNRGDDLAFEGGVAGMVVSEPHPDDRPEEIAEDGTFFGVSAVLDFLRGQRLALVSGEISRRDAAPEILGDGNEIVGG